jgi:NAD(P)H-dependent FMN reductase
LSGKPALIASSGRFSEKPAKWIFQRLKKRGSVDARLLDLRDFPMPFFDQLATPAAPGRPPYKNDVVQRWTAAIAESDGFVFVTPEYNYGPSAVLKNAIDWVYPEWNRKAACFVSYGSAMGARGVQQLRQPAIQLDQDQAITVFEVDTANHLSPQHSQLLSERGVLCFKPALRLEWRAHDGQDKIQQRDHCALTLGDSLPHQYGYGFRYTHRGRTSKFSIGRSTCSGYLFSKSHSIAPLGS